MREKPFLPFHQPLFGEEEKAEILAALESGWITTGPRTKRFEEMFGAYIGSKHAIGVNSCTAGLHLALAALDIGPGDEVITSPITFASTANVICHQQATPVFVDVEPATLNIDAGKIAAAVTPKTKALIVVHFAGHPCDMEEIIALAKKHNLFVIEDAAHAVESQYRERKVGRLGDVASFSFYATKNMTTGEGGMVTTDDHALAEKIRILSLHGISLDAWKRYSKEGYKHWDIIYPGYKYNMFDLQAALGLHQLAKIEEWLKIRRHYVGMYDEAFAGNPALAVLKPKSGIKHAHHLYVILVKSETTGKARDTIMNEIQSRGIGIGIHFRAVHLHPYYRQTFGFAPGDFPNAEYASERVISLPLYPKMSEADVLRVIDTVNDVLG